MNTKTPGTMQSQGFDWQRMKDSNPHKQSQSLVCYHYTNPLSMELWLTRTNAIIPERPILSSVFSPKSENFSSPPPGKPVRPRRPTQ